MKTSFLKYVLLVNVLLSLNALAGPLAKILPLNERFNVTALVEKASSERAQKLIGHMTLASQSIDFKLKTSAIDHLENAKAETNAMIIESKNVTQELAGLPFGKLNYDAAELQGNYYIPVWFGEGINEEIVDSSTGSGPKMEVKKSSIVLTTVTLNMKTTLEQLSKAQKELTDGNFDQARTTMDAIFNNAIISETEVDDPVLTVWSNLVLTREFIEGKEYKSAKFTMNKARSALKEIEKNKILKKHGPEAKILHDELDSISKLLDQKSPGLLLKAKNMTKEWIHKVKGWI